MKMNRRELLKALAVAPLVGVKLPKEDSQEIVFCNGIDTSKSYTWDNHVIHYDQAMDNTITCVWYIYHDGKLQKIKTGVLENGD
jgi:hypothetical protein